MSSYECFELTIDNNIAHLVFNRPESLNTMIRSFWNEVGDVFYELSENARARCVVMSSTGKHFTAGMDLSVFEGDGLAGASRVDDRAVSMEADRHFIRAIQEIFEKIDRARMPVLAAIQGGCVGGGLDLISACDVRYATEDAFFCIQEVNIGMTADAGTFPRLCRLVPEGVVREMAYTGRRVTAGRAREIGLVNEVFPTQATMLEAVMATAIEIAEKSPLAVAGSKEMINYARDHSNRDTLDHIATWQTGMFSRDHLAETRIAQQEGRKPDFPNLLPVRTRL